MNHSRGLGIGLMALALLVAFAGVVYFYVAGYGHVPIGPLALPAVIFLFGFAFFYSGIAAHTLEIQDECRDWRLHLQDDWGNLRALHPTAPLVMAALSVAALGVTFILFHRYSKWEADWGNINVVAVHSVWSEPEARETKHALLRQLLDEIVASEPRQRRRIGIA